MMFMNGGLVVVVFEGGSLCEFMRVEMRLMFGGVLMVE